jgi:hypothetical protein
VGLALLRVWTTPPLGPPTGVARPLWSSLLLLSAKKVSSCGDETAGRLVLTFSFNLGFSAAACEPLTCSLREDGAGELSFLCELEWLYSLELWNLSLGAAASFRYGFITWRKLLMPGLGCGGTVGLGGGVKSSDITGGFVFSMDFFRRRKKDDGFLANSGACSSFWDASAVWGGLGSARSWFAMWLL